MTDARQAFEQWWQVLSAARPFVLPGNKASFNAGWEYGLAEGRREMREEAAAKVESMANYTGYYAGMSNDPLLNAAEAVRELPEAPGKENV